MPRSLREKFGDCLSLAAQNLATGAWKTTVYLDRMTRIFSRFTGRILLNPEKILFILSN
jgi:hypothetical protein